MDLDDRRDGVVAAAVPRHGPRRDARRVDVLRPRPRAGRARRTSSLTRALDASGSRTYRGTATAGPNFSWVLATRALRRMKDLDLSAVRIALNGAEPVDPDAVEAFVAGGGRFGFRPGAVFPAFGMAEVAIAGTFPPPLRGHACRRRRPASSSRRSASPSPADPALDGHAAPRRCSAGRCRASRCASSTPTPVERAVGAPGRRAARSGARR